MAETLVVIAIPTHGKVVAVTDGMNRVCAPLVPAVTAVTAHGFAVAAKRTEATKEAAVAVSAIMIATATNFSQKTEHLHRCSVLVLDLTNRIQYDILIMIKKQKRQCCAAEIYYKKGMRLY